MLVICFGMSHKTAELSLREKFALGPAQLDAALRELYEKFPAAEFLLLSTCNRTELYVIRALHSHPRNEEVLAFLAEMTGLETADFEEALYIQQDAEAVAQIFAVAAGLDSLVPGESQIVSQLKQALAAAQRLQVARASMTTLVAEALHVAKHVRTETGIAQGKVSVASVALELIANRFKTLAGKTVLSVGAGKMNEIILQTLRTMLPSELLITNRSHEKAMELAESCGGTFGPFESLAELVGKSDIVITSTGSTAPIITCEMLSALPKKERLFVDLAVPRDVQADAELLDGVELYNIDDLKDTADQTLTERFKHVEQAEKIVIAHVKKFMQSSNMREVTPAIEALYARIDQIIEEELQRAEVKLASHGDNAEDMEIVKATLWRAFRKFCHPAADNLRKASAAKTAAAQAKILRQLFELGD